jgi:hypothetical protein
VTAGKRRRLDLVCPRCAFGVFGVVIFEGDPPGPFVYVCPSGHAYKIRHLTRDEQRDAKSDNPWAATPFGEG